MELRKVAILGVKWTIVGTIGRSLFQLLQISILTRILPKEVFGLVAMAVFVVQFTNIFVDMGMTSAILHRQNATQNEYSSIYWMNILCSLLLYGILFVAAPLVSAFYNEPELRVLIPLLGLNLLLMASGRQHRTILQKQFKFKVIAVTEIISYFLGLISAVTFALFDFRIYSLIYSTLFASFISNKLFLLQNFRLNPILFHFRVKEAGAFIKIGGYSMGSMLLDFFSREIDILIIGKVLGAESLGPYSLAKQIVLKLYLIINPIVIAVLSPLLSSIQNDKFRLKILYLYVVRFLAYINFPVYAMLIAASKEVMQVVYGTQYGEYHLVLSFLAFSYCLAALSNPVGSLQIATGRTDIGFKWTIFRVVITPGVIYVGAQKCIEVASGLYAILSLLLIIPLWYMQIKPMANIKLKNYLEQFYKPFLFFISAFLVIVFIGQGCNDRNIFPALLMKCCFTLILFLVFLGSFDRKNVFQVFKIIIARQGTSIISSSKSEPF